jgi:hypothetical protein
MLFGKSRRVPVRAARGKPVRSRHGPAAVTGDETRRCHCSHRKGMGRRGE